LRRAEIGVLGHLCVVVDGTPVAVARGLPTRLCVMLAAQRGTPISDDVVVDRLWAGPVPASALASLRNTAGRLRAVLGSRVLGRQADGYVLDEQLVHTDLDEFERVTARARLESDPEVARELIGTALDLVRGQPLADVESEPWAAYLVSYWDEQIAVAIDTWAELAVVAADHAAVPALRRRAEERPERENRWVHLMQLLARTGRRTEALRAFRDARSALAEFGLEPGSELRRAERSIVLDETTTGVWRPAGRRADTEAFVDRVETLRELADAIATDHVITVVGLGGVGKTRVARELMVDVAPQFPAGAVFVDLSRVSDDALVPAAIAVATGLRRGGQADERDEIDQLADVLQAEPGLLVLDNAEHVAAAVGALVARLAVRAPESRFLVTSRVPLALEGERVIRLGPLPVPPEDACEREIESYPAVQLLMQLTDAAPGECAVDAARVVRSVGGLPLGIELCARLANVLPLSEVAGGLGARVLGLGAGSGSAPLRAAFDWIVERADPCDVAVFGRLSAFRGPFTLRSAERVVNLGDLSAPVVASLGHLVESSLVQVAGCDPAAYHLDAVQACYAAEISARNGERAALDERLGSWYRSLAVELMPDLRAAGQRDAIAVLDVEMGNYRELLSRLPVTGRADDALTMAAALGEYWFLRGYWVEGAALIDAALSASAGDMGLEHALAMVQRARVCGTYAGTAARAAEMEWAMAIADRHGRPDIAREAQTWLGLARVRSGRFVEGAADLSAVVSDAARHPWAAANARMLLGMGMAMLGHGEQGRAECHRAARSFDDLGDRLNAANVLKNIGLVLHRHGDRHLAREDLQAALDAAGSLMPVLSAHARHGLAMIDVDTGRRTDEELEAELDAIRTELRRVGDVSHLSGCQRALASLRVARGDTAAALDLLREHVETLVDHDEQELGLVLLDIADGYCGLGRRSDVRQLLAAAELLATGTGYAWARAQYARLAALKEVVGAGPAAGEDRAQVIELGVRAALDSAVSGTSSTGQGARRTPQLVSTRR
jgi:predicted ATPase/DNA-binding SARP family transcriptional activator